MSKDDVIEFVGIIEEIFPGGKFRVRLPEDDVTVLAVVSGKIRKHKIHLVIGDRVKVEVSVYDATQGRITYRL